jgi:hypothetical protein
VWKCLRVVVGKKACEITLEVGNQKGGGLMGVDSGAECCHDFLPVVGDEVQKLLAHQKGRPFPVCRNRSALISDAAIQFFEKFFHVYFMDTCAVLQFLKVRNLAFEAVKAELFEYRNCLRVTAADLPDFHIFCNHDFSSVR